jgi:hypothetical protein
MNTWQIIIVFVCFVFLVKLLVPTKPSGGTASVQPDPHDGSSIAEARLEAFESALAEVELFAYELKHGLIPDGNSENNPGYGPMDFNDWQEWKRLEFERTGNLWHNHPDGLPP